MKFLILIIFISVFGLSRINAADIVIDSDMTFEEAIKGTKAPQSLIDSLRLINVEYYSFDGKLHKGQLIVNVAVVDDVTAAFRLIKNQKFPVNKVIPIVQYNWDDDESMKQNNTSAFNYRFIAGTTRLSHHATGRAIDINPRQNPVIYSDGKISPSGAKYDLSAKGTLLADGELVKLFKSNGWRWGGDWTSFKDNHHFDKP